MLFWGLWRSKLRASSYVLVVSIFRLFVNWLFLVRACCSVPWVGKTARVGNPAVQAEQAHRVSPSTPKARNLSCLSRNTLKHWHQKTYQLDWENKLSIYLSIHLSIYLRDFANKDPELCPINSLSFSDWTTTPEVPLLLGKTWTAFASVVSPKLWWTKLLEKVLRANLAATGHLMSQSAWRRS